MRHDLTHILIVLFLVSFCSWGHFCSCALGAEPNDAEVEYFEKSVRPLLSKHCYECHGAETQESKLRLDSYQGMLTGGASGPAVVAGKPEQSLLVTALHYNEDALQMPPDGKLAEPAIAALTRWVKNGAHHSEMNGVITPVQHSIDLKEAKQFWSFQPPKKANAPAVTHPEWCQTEIDFFVLAKLDQQGLKPVQPADKQTLIRRVTFDLIGLPPTPEEIQDFLSDDSEDAYRNLIDRLLDSPRYGERWGRHWLDVVRYADSNGLDENVAHGNAWRYRDYVIESLNADKPLNQFLQEQLAGDLLDYTSEEDRHQKLIATGFLTLGPKVLAEGDEVKMQMDIVDEQIDTIGKAFLGLTLGCARCHDHKFDPISTADYYALAGIFKSTKTMESLKRIAKWNENTIASAEELERQAEYDQVLAQKTQALQSLEAKLKETSVEKSEPSLEGDCRVADLGGEIKSLKEEIAKLKEQAPELPTAMGVQEAEPVNVPIHVRGSHLTLGAEVERTIPAVLRDDSFIPVATTHSGRLELAEWLVSKNHPLTSRVLVNRIWRWHFGRGLVASTENFGKLGEKPHNQQLLDWLAVELIEKDWSLKDLHREILLSSTYQLSSHFDSGNAAIDPENLSQWRFQPQRLEAEVLRDALLAVSGRLDLTMGGSLLHVKNREFIFNHTSKDETNYSSLKRSIYLPVIRNHLYDGFSLFDYTDASVPNGSRNTSTIAPQALYMLNSELVIESAKALSERVLIEQETNKDRVQSIYLLAYGRKASSDELELAIQFLNEFQTESVEAWPVLCQAILASSEFIYIR